MVKQTYGSIPSDDPEIDLELGVDSPFFEKKGRTSAHDPYSYSHAYGWLFKCLTPSQRYTIAFTFLLSTLEGYFVTRPPILLGKLVDIIDDSGAENEVRNYVIFIGAALIAKEICTFTRKLVIENIATQVQKKAFLEQAYKLLHVRVDALQDRRSGELTIRLDRSVEGLIHLMKVTFLGGMPVILTALIAVTEVFMQHWAPGAVAISVLLIIFLLTLLQIKKEKGVRIALNETKATMGGNITEILLNMAYIRASGMVVHETKRLENDAENLRSAEFMHHKIMMIFHGLRELIDGAGYTTVVMFAVFLAYNGTISSGGILTLAILYATASAPMEVMHKLIDGSHEAIVMIAALDTVQQMELDPGLKGKLVPNRDSDFPISIKGLNVAYGKNTILNNLDLQIVPGEVVGLAGATGAGKSTLIKTVLGILPDYDGKVNVLGNEVFGTDKLLLAKGIVYAQQDPFIQTGTLRSNLTLTVDANDESLMIALRKACLYDNDHYWANGLDTEIHEGGRNLSGGEKQRLSLARVFLSDAPIIVLDEATSSLDNKTEARVMENFQKFVKDQTVLMIAHRLSTLKWADRVVVMDAGTIAQSDTFQKLSDEKGLFKDLISLTAI